MATKKTVENALRNLRGRNRKEFAYNVWFDKLMLSVAQLFVYENLPPNLPQWEIEQRLIMAGRALIFQQETYGVVTSWGGTAGVNIYNNANEFNYAQPILGSQSGLIDGIDGVIMYGTSLDKIYGSSGVIGRRISYYADMLSDIDVSRQIAVINNRSMNCVSAKTDNALNELREFYRQLYNGEIVVPKISSGVLDATENVLKSVPNTTGYGLADLDAAEQNILKMFWNDFGIRYAQEKRERLLTDEINADNDNLNISICDMLQCRRDGIDKINLLYGTAIIVNVNNDIIT